MGIPMGPMGIPREWELLGSNGNGNGSGNESTGMGILFFFMKFPDRQTHNIT